MKFRSTRRKSPPVSLSHAIFDGLAPDGGLYVPETFPKMGPAPGPSSFPEIAENVMAPFFKNDNLEARLHQICTRAFSFPVPLKVLPDAGKTAVLELFHGPTLAFKDVGARFLAESISALNVDQPGDKMVLVATSGDTGGAVASAFAGRRGFKVLILFPKGRISERQRKQLTTWGGNILAIAVRGDFDDCQRLVKWAFMERRFPLISANSINIGRLLPQVAYYAASSIQYLHSEGCSPGFIIPSGNLGNAVAAFWAMKMGFPIRQIVMAVNANRSVPDFLSSGKWTPRPTIPTLANAMDVGNPSNMERLQDLYSDFIELKKEVSSISVTDDDIKRTISDGPRRWRNTWCPHTAAAIFCRQQMSSQDWIVVATAHPAKFDSIVEPLIGEPIPIPLSLRKLIDSPEVFLEIDPEPRELEELMNRGKAD